MADIIPQLGLLYPSKTLELAVFLHFNAIDQQLQVRQGQGSLARGRKWHPELTPLQELGPQAVTGGAKILHVERTPYRPRNYGLAVSVHSKT